MNTAGSQHRAPHPCALQKHEPATRPRRPLQHTSGRPFHPSPHCLLAQNAHAHAHARSRTHTAVRGSCQLANATAKFSGKDPDVAASLAQAYVTTTSGG
jgi:hypothetical protein